MRTTFSHFGICVSDPDRSVRFYEGALGFVRADAHIVGAEFAKLIELDDVSLCSQFLRRGDVAIELLHFESPGFVGTADRRPMNQLGLTHLSVRVDDLGEVGALVEELGGTVLRDTLTTLDLGGSELQFVYCTDPDGVRIELMKLGG